jgi:Kdo2-lipid IVA lauroyltransferase/acyltransferase
MTARKDDPVPPSSFPHLCATLRHLSCPMAKHGKLQTLGEYLLARSVLAALGIVPVSLATGVGRAMGFIAYASARNLRRTGKRNLELAFPEKSEFERRKILRSCFASLGRQLGFFSQFSTATPSSLLELIDLEGLEHLEAARAQGRGVILFTGHLGAWELTSLALSLRDHPLSFLVRRIDNPRVEQLVDARRTRFGNRTLDKLSAARAMVRILRSGEILGLLLDLNTLPDEAIFVNFFGIPASTGFMVAKLALRTEAPIIPIFAPWEEKRKKFAVRVEPPVSIDFTGNEDEDVRKLTAKLSLIVETQIRRYPDQWLWIHKRWKTRPPGEPGLYQ